MIWARVAWGYRKCTKRICNQREKYAEYVLDSAFELFIKTLCKKTNVCDDGKSGFETNRIFYE